MSKQINKLKKSFFLHTDTKELKYETFSGLLGVTIGGSKVVDVPNRDGYVYVRLRDNLNELIQVYNDQVSPVYDLPVLISKDNLDLTKYRVVSRDYSRYQDWGSSPLLPRHGNQHSFNPESGGGGDVVWVYGKQFMPLLLTPSGTNGSNNVLIEPHVFYNNTQWVYSGNTGTADIAAYRPTGTFARMILVYIDSVGNPHLEAGGYFDQALTGTSQIIPYIPGVPGTSDVPLGAVRVVSGTSTIGWDNIYDLRPMIVGDGFIPTGTSGHGIEYEDTPLPSRPVLNFLGPGVGVRDDAGGNETEIIISGSSSFLSLVDTKASYQAKSVLYWNGTIVDEDTGLIWDETQKVFTAGETIEYNNSAHSAIFGEANTVSGSSNLVAGDWNVVHSNDNLVTNYGNLVVGIENSVIAANSVVVGDLNFVGSGDSNEIHNDESAILGCYEGEIYGYMGTILGGNNVMVSGSYAMAYGNVAHADHDGSIVFAAGQYGDDVFVSEAEDEFAVRAYGGARFVTASGTVSIDSDGNIGLEGTSRVWKDMVLNPARVKLAGVNPPADDTIDNFAFHRYDKATEESTFFTWALPHDYAEGAANVKGHYAFVVDHPPAAGGDLNVRMGFEYKKISEGDVWDFGTGTTSGYIDETIVEGETAYILHKTADGVCNTTGWISDDLVLFRFFRKAADAADTYDDDGPAENDVWIKNYHLSYLADKLGESSA